MECKVKFGRNLTVLQIRKYELMSLAARVRALRILRGLSVTEMLNRYFYFEGNTDSLLIVYFQLGKEFFDECERGNYVPFMSYEESIDVLERLIKNLEYNSNEFGLVSSRCKSSLMNISDV